MDMEEYILLCSRHTLQNNKDGFFNDLVRKLVPLINIHQFATCETDLERVTFVVERCWNLIGAELIFKGKNAEDAAAKRLDGNAAFEKKDYQKALLLYSQSLVRAPVGPELPLVYANRSALLQKMGEFQLAINDIELAITSDYPESKKHKLYERMGSCYISLKNLTKAKVSLNLAKHLASKHDSENHKFQESLDKLLKKCDVPKDTKNSDQLQKNPSVQNATPKSPTFANASDKLGVNTNKIEGRFAFAIETVFTGEEILKEAPYAACLLLERMGSHCLHCMAKLKAPIPCENCANVAFCSRACRSSADNYHRYECRVFTLLLGSGMSVLPLLALRIITQGSAQQFLTEYPHLTSEPLKVLMDQNGQYEHTNYKNIYNLTALEDQRKPQDFLERTIMAVFLMKCLRLVGYFEMNLFKNPDATPNELKIGALILRNLQVLQFNAYEISEFIMELKENFKKSKSVNLGLGVYPTASFFNHSCAPNVTRYFCGTTICVESIGSIPQGAPITDNYGPIFTKVAKKDRQYKLHGRYWFNCSCNACLEEWNLISEAPLEITPGDSNEHRALEKLEELGKTYFEKGLELMNQGNGPAAAEFLIRYINMAEGIVRSCQHLRTYKTIQLAQEALRLCMSAKGTVHVHSLPQK